MRKKRFINGCAKSVSLVREFEAMGWDSWTCDILPVNELCVSSKRGKSC